MKQGQPVVRFCGSHAEAERAVRELQEARFDMARLSVVAREVHGSEVAVGYYKTGADGRMMQWGTMGAFWDGLWTITPDSAFFLIPELGPILIAGPLVGAIAAASGGASGGFGVLGAGLHGLGVPKARLEDCEEALRQDKLLVIAQGPVEQTALARRVLEAQPA